MKTQPVQTPRKWREYSFHPLSELIEFGVGIDIEGLAAHMQKNGYDAREEIVLFQDKILDGRHRHSAAIKAEVKPTFSELVGSYDEAMEYVLKKVHRQHLDESQRAMIGAKLAKFKKGYQKQDSEQENTNATNVSFDSNKTQNEAADALNVSSKAIQRARVVIENGTPQLQKAVETGEVSVSDAAKIAKEPAKVQNEAVKAVQSGEAKTVAKAVEEKKSDEPKDVLDQEIPPGLVGIFKKAEEFHAIVNQLNAINRNLAALKEHPAGAHLRLQAAVVDLRNLKESVRFDAPYCVCPVCKGIAKTRKANCPCKGLGWLIEGAYKNLPTEYRK